MDWFANFWTMDALYALFQVIMIDLVLAGDNAVVIGLAVAGLPADIRKKAILLGIAAATVLRIIFAALTTPGTLSAAEFHLGTAAHDFDDRIIFDAATGNLFYDRDGTGSAAAVRFAVLSGVTGTVTEADFLVI